jgi:hypothetical protein
MWNKIMNNLFQGSTLFCIFDYDVLRNNILAVKLDKKDKTDAT